MSITAAIHGHPYRTIGLSVAALVALALLSRDDHPSYQPPVNYKHHRREMRRPPQARRSRSGVRTAMCLRPLGYTRSL